MIMENSTLPKPAQALALVAGGGTMGADVAIVLARAGCRAIVLEPGATRRDALDTYFGDTLGKLVSEIGPRFAARPGGYTRILKMGHRPGDGADIARIELLSE